MKTYSSSSLCLCTINSSRISVAEAVRWREVKEVGDKRKVFWNSQQAARILLTFLLPFIYLVLPEVLKMWWRQERDLHHKVMAETWATLYLKEHPGRILVQMRWSSKDILENRSLYFEQNIQSSAYLFWLSFSHTCTAQRGLKLVNTQCPL